GGAGLGALSGGQEPVALLDPTENDRTVGLPRGRGDRTERAQLEAELRPGTFARHLGLSVGPQVAFRFDLRVPQPGSQAERRPASAGVAFRCGTGPIG